MSDLGPAGRLGFESPLGVLLSLGLISEVGSAGRGCCCSKGRPGKREFLPGVGFILK